MDEGEWTCAACTFRHAGVVAELRECTICGTSRLVVNAAQQPESRRSVDPAVSPSSPLLALPDDVLQRVLVGVPRDDHDVAALVCKRTRGIITGPRFLALRQRYGFAEYCIVTIAYIGNPTGPASCKLKWRTSVRSWQPFPLANYLSTARRPTAVRGCLSPPGPVKFWRWMPRHAGGDVSQPCPGISAFSAWRCMVDSCTSLAARVEENQQLILSTCSTKQLGCGRICLQCLMPAGWRRRASLATSCSLRVVTIRSNLVA